MWCLRDKEDGEILLVERGLHDIQWAWKVWYREDTEHVYLEFVE